MNRNTVVYTAQFDSSGNLKSDPIHAYWRRFAEQGQTKPLKMVERLFAYGVKTSENRAQNFWDVRFAALAELRAEMRQSGPFKADLWATINDQNYRLVEPPHLNGSTVKVRKRRTKNGKQATE
ncbi:DUF4833 domain-containing protein, partial [uncultured Shimia sp.]|uniref:DUF4833 domain-containing protein n=1 Tax=uncultured Shimia sp. TaxID=573152 RepID=UPI00260A39A3